MTTLCLKAKNSTETNTWSDIFTDFNTEVKSCLFVKNLTRTCISTILHIRKVLPDDYFEAKCFEGITLKLLKSNKDETVSRLEQWLEGAFEAMEKKYLKRLMLDIQDTESDKTLEIYTMTFSYNKEKDFLNSLISTTSKTESVGAIYNTKINTVKLLQMCYAVTQTYSNLPTKVKLSMRLSYYDNVPINYQPRGYIGMEFTEPEFPTQPRSIEIGVTETQHHFLKFIHKSCLNKNFFKLQNMNEETENGSATAPLEENNKPNSLSCMQESQNKVQKQLSFDNISQTSHTSLLVFSKKKTENLNLTFEKHIGQGGLSHKTERHETAKITKNISHKPSNTQKLQVRCACLSTEKSIEMFQCLSCKFMVHAECFGLIQLDFSKKIRFYCHFCHQKQINFRCHDRVMISLNNSSDQQKLSLLRRILRYCTLPSVKKITLKKMEKIAGVNCPKTVVNVVLNKMIEIGIVVPQEKKKKLLIHKEMLSVQLVHYFYKIENSNHGQSEAYRYNLRAETKRKNDCDEFLLGKKSTQANSILQDIINPNSQASEQSCDIFR